MTHRPGVALPAVLLAMALTSAIVVAGAYTARIANARARLARSATDLQAPVEEVLIDLVARWDTAAHAAIPVGMTAAEPPAIAEGITIVSWVTRLNEQTYWVIAEGASPDVHHIRGRMGVLLRVADGRVFPVSGPAWTRLP